MQYSTFFANNEKFFFFTCIFYSTVITTVCAHTIQYFATAHWLKMFFFTYSYFNLYPIVIARNKFSKYLMLILLVCTYILLFYNNHFFFCLPIVTIFSSYCTVSIISIFFYHIKFVIIIFLFYLFCLFIFLFYLTTVLPIIFIFLRLTYKTSHH